MTAVKMVGNLGKIGQKSPLSITPSDRLLEIDLRPSFSVGYNDVLIQDVFIS